MPAFGGAGAAKEPAGSPARKMVDSAAHLAEHMGEAPVIIVPCIELDPGDFYVFNTRHIHEVPLIRGETTRIVLAMFLGYSPADKEVFVWS